jgi:uncharacterized protein (TIGR02246 family)
MRYRLFAAALVLTGGLVVGNMASRPTAAAEDDAAAVGKAVALYTKAFNAADVDSIISVWAGDAEYVDEAGKTTSGRDNVKALFTQCIRDNKGCKIEIKTKTTRMLKEGIALQDGTSILTRPSGESESVPFSAVWVKKDGKWLLQLVRNLAGLTSTPSAEHNLADLTWLVGEWTATDKDSTTTITGRWMKEKKFLTLDYSVRSKGEETLSLTHIIGIDPTSGQLRSWVFNTRGGFGEGTWDRENDKWTVEMSGVAGDGKAGVATSVWTLADDNTFTYQLLNREVGGQNLPDVTLMFRHPKSPK